MSPMCEGPRYATWRINNRMDFDGFITMGRGMLRCKYMNYFQDLRCLRSFVVEGYNGLVVTHVQGELMLASRFHGCACGSRIRCFETKILL